MKTNINIHNYEEYFLLYADGELSATEVAAVKNFLSEHPELQTALDALMGSKLNAEDKIIYDNKELLLKTEIETTISLDNYEEFFLLYVDDELLEEQKHEIEKFVLQHPSLQNEFTLLKQTRLSKEKIEFVDKNSLYFKDDAEKPVVFVWLKQFAVAASVIGLIGMAWLFYSKRTNDIQQSSIAVINQPKADNKSYEIAQSSIVKQNKTTANNREKNIKIADVRKKNNRSGNIISVSNSDTLKTITENSNDVQPIDVQRISINKNIAVVDNNTIRLPQNIVQLPNKNIIVKAASTEPTNSVDNNKDNNIYVASFKINKNKIPNILKRARSILHFNSNDNDNSIAIANFSISK